MDPDIGFNFSKIIDEFRSAEAQMAKDRASPLFVPRETDTMFILTAHLKGYKRETIKIEINQDVAQISVSGERPIQETVMVGEEPIQATVMVGEKPVQETMIRTKEYSKERKMIGFRKAFKNPGGVILDQIKARFDSEESALTISIPKLVEGIRGISIEEVKVEEINRRNTKSLQITANGVGFGKFSEEIPSQEVNDFNKQTTNRKKVESQDRTGDIVEPKEEKLGEELDQVETLRVIQAKDQDQEVRWKEEIQKRENDTKEEQGTGSVKLPEKRFKLCVPMIAGSAFLVSVIVLAIHLTRTKSPPRKKKH